MSKAVLFQTIQFSISTQFSSIWPIDRTLSGVTTPSQSGPGSDGNEGILCIPQSSNITINLTIRLFSVISRILVEGSLTPLQRSSQCILQPQPTGQIFPVLIPKWWRNFFLFSHNFLYHLDNVSFFSKLLLLCCCCCSVPFCCGFQEFVFQFFWGALIECFLPNLYF